MRSANQQVLFARMLRLLPEVTIPDGPNASSRPLAKLTTRMLDDPSIALLYAWAVAGDILNFYNGRIRQEGYLDSSTERLSLVELGRLLGYRPAPALGARTHLAFTLEDGDEAPARVAIPAGTQVDSVPSVNQQPQTFETTADLEARVEWNAIRPQLARKQVLDTSSTGILLLGTSTDLNPGDYLLLLAQNIDGMRWRALLVRSVTTDDDRGTTRVDWGTPLGPDAPVTDPAVFAFRTSGNLFGYDAPEWKEQPFEVQLAITPSGYQPQDFRNWPGFAFDGSPIDLDAVYREILPGSWLLLMEPAAVVLNRAGAVTTVSRAAFTLTGQVTSVVPDQIERRPFGNVLAPPRDLHATVALPNGRIMIFGGRVRGKALRSTQICDPDSGRVLPGPDLLTARYEHTATLLSDGSILIAGGIGDDGALLSAELYSDGVFQPTEGAMNVPRAGHTATPLPDGRVLLSGGADQATAEIFEPADGTFQAPIQMSAVRRLHTATLYTFSGEIRVLVAGGEAAGAALSSAETFVVKTGSFTAIAASMKVARTHHAASLSKPVEAVLVSGGAGPAASSTELYRPDPDPGKGVFESGPDFADPRWSHTSTVTQSGEIFLAGGTGMNGALASVEVYAPGTPGSLLRRSELSEARSGHTTTLLDSGDILFAGGSNGTGPIDKLDRYVPSAFTFVPTGNMGVRAYFQAGVLLENGYFLATGGYEPVTGNVVPNKVPLQAARVYDPETEIFVETSRMNTCRAEHTATLLTSGAVLVAGGRIESFRQEVDQILSLLTALQSLLRQVSTRLKQVEGTAQDITSQADFVNSSLQGNLTGEATANFLGDPLPAGHSSSGPLQVQYHLRYYVVYTAVWFDWSQSYASLLPSGVIPALQRIQQDAQVIQQLLTSGTSSLEADVEGAIDDVKTVISLLKEFAQGGLFTAELYDPKERAFSPTNNHMIYCRRQHTSSLLPDGTVLLAGGMGKRFVEKGNPLLEVPLPNAELYNPGSGEFVELKNEMSTPRYGHSATPLPNGFVLIAGGLSTSSLGTLTSAEVYDPSTNSFSAVPSMNVPRAFHTATLLSKGEVLMCGGVDRNGAPVSSAEIYYPSINQFVRVGELTHARGYHCAALLDDGNVLFAAGWDGHQALKSAEIYDTSLSTFKPAADLTVARLGAICGRLADGSVLIAGGAYGDQFDHLKPEDSAELFVVPKPDERNDVRRNTTVFAQSELLDLAREPITEPVQGNSITLDTLQPGLRAGQILAVKGTTVEGSDEGEVREIAAIAHSSENSTVTFQAPLSHVYRRDTVALNGNVAEASQGKSTETETLGGGDGRLANQRFQLPSGPLTYLPADNARGYQPQLELLINDVKWDATASLLSLGPDADAYMVTTTLDGRTEVVTGDGQHGRRLPNGTDNVAARYRIGAGPAGNVPPGTITMLQSPVESIHAVTNPAASSGGTSAESLSELRGRIPISVQDLGFIVSDADFGTFASNFAGVAKARFDRVGELACVTVAGEYAAAIEYASPLFLSLFHAIETARDPAIPFRILSFEPLFFIVHAHLWFDPRLDPKTIEEDVINLLRSRFGFDARQFAQGAAASTVLSTMLEVRGVLAADLAAFHLSDASEPKVVPFLDAQPARDVRGETRGAQILLIDAGSIRITQESAA